MAVEDPLVRMWQRAYKMILERMRVRPLGGTAEQHHRSILDDINRILAELLDATARFIEREMPREYENGQQRALSGLLRASDPAPERLTADASRRFHRASVAELAANLFGDLQGAAQMVGRRAEDLLREVGLEANMGGRLRGETIPQITKRLAETIEERGLPGMIDSAGREWAPDVYAKMATRTTLAEAQNLGAVNQLREAGRDLVQITEHKTTCPICSKYEGRVYTISGLDLRYPRLYGTAFGVASSTIHPNCRHRITPYVERFADDPEGDRLRSNRPFVDDRSEAQKRAYDEAQARKRRARAANQ